MSNSLTCISFLFSQPIQNMPPNALPARPSPNPSIPNYRYFFGMVLFLHLYHTNAPTQHV